MSLKYERRLLDHMQHERYAPGPIGELREELGIPAEEHAAFDAAIEDLRARKMIQIDASGRVQLPKMGDIITGRFRKNQRGFGFVIPEIKYREGDLFIPPDQVGDALTGDIVRAGVTRGQRRGEDDVTGTIIAVLERKRSNFTGQLVKRGSLWIVLPDGREMTQPIVVDDPAVKNAKVGDKVGVEITQYAESANELAKGVIVKVLGEAGLPDVETQAVILAYNLPGEFPKECVEQARAATRQFDIDVAQGSSKGFPDRIDLRTGFVITIDPPDAKDYDDAISIQVTPEGWDLGVHIADVAHFIPPGSPLDVEARERGNSVYLPRLVIPMLPEVLSNGICSLAEGVPRFTKSAFMSYGHDGRILSERCAQTIIQSAKRLTYLEAQALIDGDIKEARKHAKTEPRYTDELIKALREMDKCSKMIRARRKKAGMIHLDLPEVNLIFDDAGHVIDAEPEDNAYTHTLIEMFMVEANEVLARLFEGMGVPLLRRVHPEPTPGDVADLRQTAKVAGFTIPKSPTRAELQALLDATAGTSAARAVHTAVLRTLTKAEYSPALIGHFALASEAYAHFTSPIRRYPDLTVHRALAAYLGKTDNARGRPQRDADKKRLGKALLDLGPEGGVLDQDELVEIGRSCSQTEDNAEAAEHSLRGFLILQLLQNHLGESFPAVITGVTRAGVFVQLEKFLADGMIKSEDLPTGAGRNGAFGGGGRWFLDQRTGALVNQATGRSFNVGDRVRVTIAAIDLAMRQMSMVITDPNARDVGKSKLVVGAGAGGGGAGAGKKGGLAQRAAVGGVDIDEPIRVDRASGSQRRSKKSKQRDRAKPEHRVERKKKRRK